MQIRWSKKLLTAIKIAVSITFLVLVFSSLDFNSILSLLSKIDYFYLILALFFFLISQWNSVYRLDLFLGTVGVELPINKNVQLYLLGMFYNFFIPGGIGGDAYKVYFLNQYYKTPVKKLAQAIFFDRLFGLFAIFIGFGILFLFVEFRTDWLGRIQIPIILIFLFAGTIVAFKLFNRWFTDYANISLKALMFSVLVQGFQLMCVTCLLFSFGIESNYISYFILFLISSITSVISFSGIGLREAVFFYGAKYLNFNPEISTSVGFSFTLLTLVVSLFGMYFLFYPIKIGKEKA